MNDYAVHQRLVERLLTWEEDGTLDALQRIIWLVNSQLDSVTPEKLATLVQHLQKIDEVLQIS